MFVLDEKILGTRWQIKNKYILSGEQDRVHNCSMHMQLQGNYKRMTCIIYIPYIYSRLYQCIVGIVAYYYRGKYYLKKILWSWGEIFIGNKWHDDTCSTFSSFMCLVWGKRNGCWRGKIKIKVQGEKFKMGKWKRRKLHQTRGKMP